MAALAIGLSVLFCVLILEIGLRFLPIPTGLAPLPVTQEDPVARFTPDQDYVWSSEWNFAIHNKGHINNAGFVNDQDYDANDTRPLMAVIGDSYVEAVMVPFAHTIQGRLAQSAAPDHRVYSFAASGAPLSQYLVWAKYAREQYRPSAMTFVIVGNDFDESLPAYTLHQIFQQFVPGKDGQLELKLLQEFRPSWRRAAIKSSALARYMFYNLKLWLTWSTMKQTVLRQNLENTEYAGNTSASTDEKRMKDSKDAVDAFFRLLPEYSGLAPKDIAFVVDSSRGWIYKKDRSLRKGYFDEMRVYLMTAAQKRGYAVVDMDGPFERDFNAHNIRFEYPTDGHWNDHAHGLAADALSDTAFYKRFIAQ